MNRDRIDEIGSKLPVKQFAARETKVDDSRF